MAELEDYLRERAQAVLTVDIPEDPNDIHFISHSRDWCLGYRMAFQDLLITLDRQLWQN